MSLVKGASILGVGMGVVDGGMTYYGRRAEHPEESKATSAVYAGIDVALWTFLPGVAFAKEAYGITRVIGESGAFDHRKQESKFISNNLQGASWNYNDTQQAATMRQRGLDAIQNSRMNARSALGGEARSLHRGAF